MIKILLPVMGANKNDVETMFSLLERTVDQNKYEIGLEVIGKHEHFHGPKSAEFLEQIKDNIDSIAKGIYTVVHGFSGLPVYTEGVADMRTEVGRTLLETYLRLGETLGAAYVHVHSAAGYRGAEIPSVEKRIAAQSIKMNMMIAVKNTGSQIPVGIENLPTPSMGDEIFSADEIYRDCVETLEECGTVVKGTDFKITLDTCHYAADKEKIDLTNAIREIDFKMPFAWADNNLKHLHVSDISGFWIPNELNWTEGVIPGEGRIGEQAFKEFFEHINEYFPDIGICVEVTNKDFKNPAESEESLKRVLNWLG